ncbi:MAG: long-chain fatty acid--CoA ligase [Desulfobacteraceae bacterium]|nr:long-chain fatty acid--CoA ligase [Desulfobacteraceae bacterium]
MNRPLDIITPETAGNLGGLFRERVRRSPYGCAYRRFDSQGRCCACTSWAGTAALAARWQEAMRREGLQPGDRVAIMLKNSLEWVLFDLAALGLGLVTVPLYVNDRPENFARIIQETGSRILLIEGVEQWERIREVQGRLDTLVRIISLTLACTRECDLRLALLDDWLPDSAGDYEAGDWPPDALASIVYTSGTTGNPKGVMLSHANILTNVHAGIKRVVIHPDDLFLSFLPLSHTLERTAGYYVPLMSGASVAHVRSLEQLPDDLTEVRPTIIISVPRVFERLHNKITGKLDAGPRWKRRLFDLTIAVGWRRFLHSQGRGGWSPLYLLWPLLDRVAAQRIRAALGGRVRMAISGGAPLNPEIARFFIALGLPLLQGYGLTETSPVISVNSLEDNRPETVGRPLSGVEVEIGANSELLVRGPNLMSGYWRNPDATAAVIDRQGWLHTGDQARIAASGQIIITGRLKEIIVLANGEKVAPAELEMALNADRLFEQTMVVGEGRPYLSALLVLNEAEWFKLAGTLAVDAASHAALESAAVEQALLERIAPRLARFPGYARIRRVRALRTPWNVQEGLMTATLKLRRKQLQERYADEIENMYAGHGYASTPLSAHDSAQLVLAPRTESKGT